MARRASRANRRRAGPRCRRTAALIVVCAAVLGAWCGSSPAEQPVPLPPIDLPPGMQALPSPDGPAAEAVAVEPSGPTWPDWATPSFDWNPSSWDPDALRALGPGSTSYAFAELVALQRDNQSTDVPLVIDTLNDQPVLSVGDLNAPVGYGVRAFVGERGCNAWGWEAGYLGVYGMGTTQTLSGTGNLQLAGPLANQVFPFFDADTVVATYGSSLQSGEFNVFRSCCRAGRSGCGACGGSCGGCCIDWLGGFRYVNLTEEAGMTFTCCTTEPLGPYTSSYDVLTTNNLVGGQFGGRASRTWGHWAVEGWAKTGVFANVQNQAQGPVVDPLDPTQPRPDRRYGSAIEPAMLADLNLSIVYRINRVFGLRVGYNALWVGNVALAPEQWNFGTAGDAGMGIIGHGGLFMNGANIGIDACW